MTNEEKIKAFDRLMDLIGQHTTPEVRNIVEAISFDETTRLEVGVIITEGTPYVEPDDDIDL